MMSLSMNQRRAGFYGAAYFEFITDRDRLEFMQGFVPGDMPPCPDLLIIQTQPIDNFENEIGRLFRKFNLVEFKNADDSPDINDLVKAQSYAGLFACTFKAPDTLPLNEITVTLVHQHYPTRLIDALKENSYTVSNSFDGIYYISGKLMFATQIVVIEELPRCGHNALRVLTSNADETDIEQFVRYAASFTEEHDKENADNVLKASMAANSEIYRGLLKREDMCHVLSGLLKDDTSALEMLNPHG